jgi:hypothetical protein
MSFRAARSSINDPLGGGASSCPIALFAKKKKVNAQHLASNRAFGDGMTLIHVARGV